MTVLIKWTWEIQVDRSLKEHLGSSSKSLFRVMIGRLLIVKERNKWENKLKGRRSSKCLPTPSTFFPTYGVQFGGHILGYKHSWRQTSSWNFFLFNNLTRRHLREGALTSHVTLFKGNSHFRLEFSAARFGRSLKCHRARSRNESKKEAEEVDLRPFNKLPACLRPREWKFLVNSKMAWGPVNSTASWMQQHCQAFRLGRNVDVINSELKLGNRLLRPPWLAILLTIAPGNQGQSQASRTDRASNHMILRVRQGRSKLSVAKIDKCGGGGSGQNTCHISNQRSILSCSICCQLSN